jgi:hypothetical protein
MLAGWTFTYLFWSMVFGAGDDEEEKKDKVGLVLNPANPRFGQFRVGNFYLDPSNNRINLLRTASQTFGIYDKKMTQDQMIAFEERGEFGDWPTEDEVAQFKDMAPYDKAGMIGRLITNRFHSNAQLAMQTAIGEYREGGPIANMEWYQAGSKMFSETYTNLLARDLERVVSETDDFWEALKMADLMFTGTSVQRPETIRERMQRKATEESFAQEIGR